jgi:rhodanese-related sulfurtransferase
MKILTTILAVLSSLTLVHAGVTDVTVEEASKQLKKNPKTVVIDLRTPEEFKEGHLKGAINLNFHEEDFEKKLAKLDRDQTYLMHCLGGGRSAASIPVWEKLGFKKVLHLKAGKQGWAAEGKPLVVPEVKEEKEKDSGE